MPSAATHGRIEKANQADESSESRVVIGHGFAVARSLGIRKILIQADELRDQRWARRHQKEESLIWLCRTGKSTPRADGNLNHVLELPGCQLPRMDQIHIGLMMAVSRGYVRFEETVLILTGLVGSHRLDGILIANPQRDHSWLKALASSDPRAEMLRSRSFFRLLDIALRFAKEGREGKSIGTTFVLGDLTPLEKYLRQMILNPCRGHPQRTRNIHSEDFLETLREWAAIDGAFAISPSGVVERCGAYLSPPLSRRRVQVDPGQGARHTSACATTAACDALAIVLSESSSAVTVYHKGAAIMKLNKPR